MKRTLCSSLLFFALHFALAQQPSTNASKETVTISMRDGVLLATDVYQPQGNPPFPVVLVRSPYNKDLTRDAGLNAAKLGYVMVIQDTRGRFASQGDNLPFDADGWAGHWDGYDTVEWIAQQPWCNGRIGTFGGSAVAITQLQLAGSGNDKVACQHLTVGGPSLYHDVVYTGGVFRKSLAEDWLRISKFSPEALKLWTSHSSYDSYWRDRDVSRRYGRINAAAIHIGGYFDIFAQGTIDAFVGYQTRGGPKARGRQKLLMGPWTHGVLTDKAGDLKFPNAKRPPNNIHDHVRWWEHHLKGVSNGVAEAAAVTYYVMGDAFDPNAPGNGWRTADQWPPVDTKLTPFYLHADRTLSAAPPAQGSPASFTYDPENPVPTVGGYQLTLPAGPKDQRELLQRRDVLSFTSEPLGEPLEVTGRVRLRLFASSDAPDTDFVAKLCDVYPDGRSFNICEGILRARYRESLSREKLLKPGKVYAIEIDLWSTSMVFNRGHRLRVLVTSSSSPGYDPNPNTGEPFRHSNKIRVAHNTVHLSGRNASHILLPVVVK